MRRILKKPLKPSSRPCSDGLDGGSHLLSLPVEIRLQVYELLLEPHRTQVYYEATPSIISVCRQIREEAIPIYLSKHYYFTSLTKLIQWTSTGAPHLLQHVRDVSMTVDRGFLDELNAEEKPNLQSPPPSPSQQGLTFRLLKVIRRPSDRSATPDDSPAGQRMGIEVSRTLHALGNLRIYRVHFDLSNDMRFATQHRRFLALLTASCPEIRDFTFSIYTVHLKFLEQFQHLRSFQFSGYSRSSPEETLQVLRNLRNLEALTLSTVPDPSRDGNRTHKQNIFFSINEHVIQGMWPLKSLSVLRGITNEPSPALTMIGAWKRHQKSLRKLYIWTNHSLGVEQVMELLELTSGSTITDLTLWIPGKSEILDVSHQVPQTVKRGYRAVRCDGLTQDSFALKWIEHTESK